MIVMSKFAEKKEALNNEEIKIDTPDIIEELSKALANASIEAQEAAVKETRRCGRCAGACHLPCTLEQDE